MLTKDALVGAKMPHEQIAGACLESASAAPPFEQDEKISVLRIDMHVRCRETRAVLGSFFAADHVLQDWAKRWGCAFYCEFFVTYHDGYQVSGQYHVAADTAAPHLLSKFIRSSVQSAASGKPHNLILGIQTRPFAFSDRYEIGDCL